MSGLRAAAEARKPDKQHCEYIDTLMKNIIVNVLGKANCTLFFDWALAKRNNRESLEAPVEIKDCIEK
jgi:hypothetical protein